MSWKWASAKPRGQKTHTEHLTAIKQEDVFLFIIFTAQFSFLFYHRSHTLPRCQVHPMTDAQEWSRGPHCRPTSEACHCWVYGRSKPLEPRTLLRCHAVLKSTFFNQITHGSWATSSQGCWKLSTKHMADALIWQNKLHPRNFHLLPDLNYMIWLSCYIF